MRMNFKTPATGKRFSQSADRPKRERRPAAGEGKAKPARPKKKSSSWPQYRRLLTFAALALAVALILSIRLAGGNAVSLNVGEIAGEDVYYQGAVATYTSEIRTEEARTIAAAKVEQIFNVDPQAANDLSDTVDQYFQDIQNAQTEEDGLSRLAAALPGSYEDGTLQAILLLPAKDLTAMEDLLQGVLRDVYDQGITEEEIPQAREKIAAAIASSTVTGQKELFLKSLAEGLDLPANKEYDALATAQAVEEAMDEISAVQVTVQPGEKLVSRGSMVTDDQVEALQALGLYRESSLPSPYAGILLLSVVCCILLYYYLKLFQPQIFRDPKRITLFAVVLATTLLLCKIISLITVESGSDFRQLIGYMLPAGAATMLVSVLLSRDAAIFTTVLFAVFTGVITNGNFSCVLVTVASGLTAAYCTSRMNQRSQFVVANVYIVAANAAVILSYGLIQNYDLPYIGLGMIFGLANSLLCTILAMGVLPFLESGFGVTTSLRLLELSNSNNPLLKRLMMEAPGTYNHSILVGNLAEAAADAIEADPLLVRVASYYHDIGKLRRPYFFIENQHPGENPHDKLQPAVSAMIITSHVTEGSQMLRQEKFPQEIIDLVEQHHGTGFLGFFYHKALEQAENKENIKKDDFRYQGPKPQTREAGLVLLADSVQAAVQSLEGVPSREQMAQVVEDIIKGKIDDGQLQQCPLTFRDLQLVSQSFLTVLGGMYHQRIAYPTLDKEEKNHADTLIHQPGAGNDAQPVPLPQAEAGGENRD
ncbi:MAG: HDIG domain-containing protein [Firmicutes bacterium]|nr:HDIG domain-containing protein [Bacillota bacterium]